MRLSGHRGGGVLAAALLGAIVSSAPDAGAQQPAPQRAPANAATPTQPPKPPQPAPIDRNGVLILIRSTVLALHHANLTGNYTVLRDLGAPGFQTVNTAARLSEIFANLRAQNLDLSGVSVLEPQLTVLPQIEANGMMRMAGVFPSTPLQVNFELLFAPVDNRWKLYGLSLNLAQSTPTPPPGPPVADASPPPQPATPANAETPRATPAATSAAQPAQRPAEAPKRPPGQATR